MTEGTREDWGDDVVAKMVELLNSESGDLPRSTLEKAAKAGRGVVEYYLSRPNTGEQLERLLDIVLAKIAADRRRSRRLRRKTFRADPAVKEWGIEVAPQGWHDFNYRLDGGVTFTYEEPAGGRGREVTVIPLGVGITGRDQYRLVADGHDLGIFSDAEGARRHLSRYLSGEWEPPTPARDDTPAVLRPLRDALDNLIDSMIWVDDLQEDPYLEGIDTDAYEVLRDAFEAQEQAIDDLLDAFNELRQKLGRETQGGGDDAEV